MPATLHYFLIVHIASLCLVFAIPNNLNRCLQGKHHKTSPGKEGDEFKKYHCFPWSSRSCCTSKTSQAIQQDGALTLYNMKWNHCQRNLSSACRQWFQRDTCFYECSPNLGPWIVVDRRSTKTRSERIMNVPVCGNECDAWFGACKDDLTCSDDWGKYWKWTKAGNTCIKECKTFKEYFKDAENFCSNIFHQSFRYAKGIPGKDCFSLWPNISKTGKNPNDDLVVAAQKLLDQQSRDTKIEKFLDRCVTSKNHKGKPGLEQEGFSKVCVPWRAHSCCTNTTTNSIEKDGAISLYRMKWDHCGNLSKSCRDYFIKDTCFYECSPNLTPWIVKDRVSKYTRNERVMNVPLCSSDCDNWFEACKDDYTCSDNWGQNWKWTKTGNNCTLNCKRFKDYFPNSVTFCNKIFNYSFAYTEGTPGKDCVNLWPDSNVGDLNRQVAYLAAKKIVYQSSVAVMWQTPLSFLLIALIFSVLTDF